MRSSLWPDSIDTNTQDIRQYFSGESPDIKECFLAMEKDLPIGFIELSIRNHAEGSDQAEIPYVEGWYIDEEYRGKGIGKRLMDEAEVWARRNGFSELASDAEIGNGNSISAHERLGFTETGRIVCFIKLLT